MKENSTQRGMRLRLRRGIILPPETDKILHGYKEPLTAVHHGFGYIGTVAFNAEKTHIQCHICGFFFKSLGKHIGLSHGVKAREYRDWYGIMSNTPLVAPATLDRYRQVANNYLVSVNNTPERKQRRLEALAKGRQTALEQPWNQSSSWKMERLNRLGRCPEQLLYKIDVLARQLGRTPTKRDFIIKYGDGGDLNMIYRTFDTWNNAVKLAGLTPNQKGRVAA